MKKRISVRGLVVTEKGLSVIYRRKKDNDRIKEYYVIPGGGVEEEEDLIEALKRELEEELDIKVEVNELAFQVETESRIEYFYNCTFIKGNFKLNGEELERMTKDNYYEPTFIELSLINNYDIMEEVKDYFNNQYFSLKK